MSTESNYMASVLRQPPN